MRNQYIVKPHLDGSSFQLPGNRTGFVLLHGFTATTTEVKPLAERLHHEGYTISAPLLPGHDSHPDDLNATAWQDWYGEAKNAYLSLRASSDQVWVGGESMGALLCLLLATEFPEVAGLLLFAPALKVRSLKAAYLAQFFIKYLDKSQKSNDQEWKGYNVYPMKGAVQLLKLQKKVRGNLHKVSQPTLVVVSKADQTVPVNTGEEIIGSISSAVKQQIVLQGAPHTMLLGEDNQHIIDQAIEFIHSVS
ncbi:MAG: alpha/beta fold hydrolase [Chloroflexi bacterium]|nr:alpha/beta fold hydrolase [Chloroflexota bacterium]